MAVEAAGSFIGAAEHLGVSASHVSRAVSLLEDRIHAQLFFRTTRRVALTDSGRSLIEGFRALVQARNELLLSYRQKDHLVGEIRVTCAITLGERFVAPLLMTFGQLHPQLSVQLDLTNRLVDLVDEGFDIAIRTGLAAPQELNASRLTSRRLHLCASKTYLRRWGSPTEISALSFHKCLIGSSPTWQFKDGAKVAIFRPKGPFQCNSGRVLVSAALQHMGICQLPEFYVNEYIQRGELETVLDDFRPDDEPIWVVHAKTQPESRRVSALVEYLAVKLTGF